VRLVVVTDVDARRKIAELGGEPYYVERGLKPWISRAPVHVVIGMREEDYHDRYREPDKIQADGSEIEWPVPWWWVDAGKAMMVLLLAAVDEGLGAGLFGLFGLFPAENNDRLRELLGMPADVAIVGVVTIGHPAPEPTADRRKEVLRRRRPLEEVIRWERW
jgi:FMN reductase [NAD(P)H]